MCVCAAVYLCTVIAICVYLRTFSVHMSTCTVILVCTIFMNSIVCIHTYLSSFSSNVQYVECVHVLWAKLTYLYCLVRTGDKISMSHQLSAAHVCGLCGCPLGSSASRTVAQDMKKSLLPSPKEAKKVMKEDTVSSEANLVKTRGGCQGEIGEDETTIPPSLTDILH